MLRFRSNLARARDGCVVPSTIILLLTFAELTGFAGEGDPIRVRRIERDPLGHDSTFARFEFLPRSGGYERIHSRARQLDDELSADKHRENLAADAEHIIRGESPFLRHSAVVVERRHHRRELTFDVIRVARHDASYQRGAGRPCAYQTMRSTVGGVIPSSRRRTEF